MTAYWKPARIAGLDLADRALRAVWLSADRRRPEQSISLPLPAGCLQDRRIMDPAVLAATLTDLCQQGMPRQVHLAIPAPWTASTPAWHPLLSERLALLDAVGLRVMAVIPEQQALAALPSGFGPLRDELRLAAGLVWHAGDGHRPVHQGRHDPLSARTRRECLLGLCFALVLPVLLDRYFDARLTQLRADIDARHAALARTLPEGERLARDKTLQAQARGREHGARLRTILLGNLPAHAVLTGLWLDGQQVVLEGEATTRHALEGLEAALQRHGFVPGARWHDDSMHAGLRSDLFHLSMTVPRVAAR